MQGDETDAVELLVAGLDFTHENLPSAMADHPTLFLRAGRYRVGCMEERMRCKAALEETRVGVATTFRRRAERAKERVTVQKVDEHVSGHPVVRAAQTELDAALVAEEYSRLLLEAYYQRQRMMSGLVSMAGIEAGGVNAPNGGLESLKRRVAEKYS